MHERHGPLWRGVLLSQVVLAVGVAGLWAGPPDGGFRFRRVWGYVYKGEEKALTGSEPITDIAYFSLAVNDLGRLDRPGPGPMRRPVLSSRPGVQRRVHLVVSAPSNRSLMYWCLSRDLVTRAGLIQDIVAACADFDGVQIDFETIRPQEGQAYVSFLKDLKVVLGPAKALSVAVPARTRVQEDAYDYAAIAAIADAVLVMAYDEHWRTGSPGPIASVDWCRRVCAFAMQKVPSDKLVMGLPLYGRAWQEENPARALTWDQTQGLLRSLSKSPLREQDGTPFFEYWQPSKMRVFYEDMESLSAKLALYQEQGVQAVGFWRIGQGPPDLWRGLSLSSG